MDRADGETQGAPRSEALESMSHSLSDSAKVLRQNDINSATPKYRGLVGGLTTVIREQGIGGLYAGAIPTAIRQASSVAVRFMLYAEVCPL